MVSNSRRAKLVGALDFIEHRLGMADVELKNNFYWSVPDEALHLMDNPPEQLDVGSLFDDWDFVEIAAKNLDQQIPLVFMHAAPVLHALSQAVPSFTDPREHLSAPKSHDHLVQIDERRRELRIYRLDADGTKTLFTSVPLPSTDAREVLTDFATQLGENLLLDSPPARKLFKL